MTADIRHTLCRKSGQTKVQRWPNKVDLRAEWPLEGIQSEKVARGRCSPILTNHVALFGLGCTRLGLVSTLHFALAMFQQGAPCFGHRPINNDCTYYSTALCRTTAVHVYSHSVSRSHFSQKYQHSSNIATNRCTPPVLSRSITRK